MNEKNKALEQSNNVANARMHKHCIFCGISSDAGGLVGAICPSKNNTFPPNTVGDRPHAYPVASTPQPAAPSDPYAKLEALAQRWRTTANNYHYSFGREVWAFAADELEKSIAELRAGEGER